MELFSITHCTASKAFISDFKVSDITPNQSFAEVSECWSRYLKKRKPLYYAREMYSGGGFKKLNKTLLQKEFLIVSAGLGLVSSDQMIPSYECTVSRGKVNSISDYFKDEFSYNEWWKYLVSSKYSSDFINIICKKSDTILISLTGDYLKMVAQDLKLLKKNFYIFTGSRELAISLGFEQNLMPYNDVFDGPNGTLRGTNRDFSQRTHADFIKRLNKYNNFDEAYESVEFDMQTWTPPTKHNNVKKTDEEILSLIKTNENKFSKVTDLLRYFRFELKVACEEKRFKSLYKNFKEIKECQKLL